MISEIIAVTLYVFGAVLMFAIIGFGIDHGRLEAVTAEKYKLFCVVIWPAIMLIVCFDLVKERVRSL